MAGRPLNVALLVSQWLRSPVSADVVRDAPTAAVYQMLANCTNGSIPTAFPSLDALRRYTRLSRSAVAKSLADLERAELVKRQRRTIPGTGEPTSTLYTIHVARLLADLGGSPQDGLPSPGDGLPVVREADGGSPPGGPEVHTEVHTGKCPPEERGGAPVARVSKSPKVPPADVADVIGAYRSAFIARTGGEQPANKGLGADAARLIEAVGKDRALAMIRRCVPTGGTLRAFANAPDSWLAGGPGRRAPAATQPSTERAWSVPADDDRGAA